MNDQQTSRVGAAKRGVLDSWKRKTGAAFAALAGSIALVIPITALPASASTGNVYVVTARQDGWCPGSGNYVTFVNWATFSGPVTASGGDGGDDIVYPRVALNTSNTIVLAVSCKKTTPMGTSIDIKPTRTGLTYFVNTSGRVTKVK
ncbi:MAG TPA: hypothetical protein VH914_12215 [Acidimicrobiia bacterium]|nr:hypothetical protein [Acidimicrobiia bacterium]